MRLRAISLFIFWSAVCLFSGRAYADDLPLYLFHAGAHSVLQEDVAARTVPANAWNTFIFGKTGFDLPRYRRGLYGAENISGTSLYSSYNFLAGTEPWVIAIRLKDSCRSQKAAFNADLSIDFKKPSEVFEKWYLSHREKYRHLEKLCLTMIGEKGNWQDGAPYNVSAADPLTQKQTHFCGKVINDFLEDLKIKVVLDVVNDKSWYVRDRSCIESILGTPNELFDLIFTRQIGSADSWPENLLGDAFAPGFSFPGNTILLLNVLSQATIGTAEVQKIESVQKELRTWLSPESAPAISPKHPQLERNEDDPWIIAKALKATLRAQQNGQIPQFQEGLRERVKSLIQKLGEQCQSKNGVPESRKQACSSESSRQSLVLEDFLEPQRHD